MIPTPYYQDQHVTLYHGDCLELSELWVNADVLVTDPPYGMDYQSGHRKQKLAKIHGDKTADLRNQMLKKWRNENQSKPGLLFGRWSVEAPEGERQRLIWWKKGSPGMGDLRIPWGPAHEDIHLIGHGWNVSTTGQKRQGSVIPMPNKSSGRHVEANRTGHPTPKPVELMEALITRCPPGVIADPFAGAGATLVAAKNLSRRAIGIELEERYCETVAKRLSQISTNLGAEK